MRNLPKLLPCLVLLLVAAGRKKIEVTPPIPQTHYFECRPGTSILYSERRRKFLQGDWRDTGRTLRLEALDAAKGKNLELNFMGEITSGSQPEEKLFVTIILTPSQVEFIEDGSRVIASLPLRTGDWAGDYQTVTLQKTLETSTGTFRHCLEIRGGAESFVFAPYTGLVQWLRQDQEWTVKGTRAPRGSKHVRLRDSDRAQIEKLASDFCKRYQVNFERFLSADEMAGSTEQVLCRFLISRPDPEAGGGKHFEVEERIYLRGVFGAETLWGESEPKAP